MITSVRKEKVTPVIERLYCDECDAEMQFTGTVLASYPAQYPHQCPKCQKKTTITGKHYPIISYEEDV